MNYINTMIILVVLLTNDYSNVVEGAECKLDDHYPETGRYPVEDINGFEEIADPCSTTKRRKLIALGPSHILSTYFQVLRCISQSANHDFLLCYNHFSDSSSKFCSEMFCSET